MILYDEVKMIDEKSMLSICLSIRDYRFFKICYGKSQTDIIQQTQKY